jgi:hypothetical protein
MGPTRGASNSKMQSCSSRIDLPLAFRLAGVTPVFADLGEEGVYRSWVACSKFLSH